MARTKESLIQAANEVIAALDAGSVPGPGGPVAIGDAVAAAVAGTRVVKAEALAALAARPSSGPPPAVSLVEATTQVVAQALAGEGHRVGVLDFASAREVGGGFLAGSGSQEEDLCRCSALYRCLQAATDYYALHAEVPNAVYGGHAAFAPDVPFFRVAEDQPWLAAPFRASVVVMAAPNARLLALGGEAHLDLQPTLEARIRGILALFRDAGLRQLVLGAWGCGDFGNDPRQVGEIFRDALADPAFGGAFDRVVFAIRDTRSGQPAWNAFRRVFRV